VAVPISVAMEQDAGPTLDATHRQQVDKMNDRARAGLVSDLPRALAEASHAAALADSLGYPLGRARALCIVGESHSRLGTDESSEAARTALLEAIAAFDAVPDRLGEAEARNALAALEVRRGRYPEGIEQFVHALTLAQLTGNRLVESNALNGLAAARYSLGDYRRAASTFLEALKIKRAIGDRATEAGCLNNLGLVYQDLGDHREAAKLHREALEIKRELRDLSGEAAALGNLGMALHHLGLPEEARPLHEEALRIARGVGDRHIEAGCLENLGLVAAALGEGVAALGLYLQALDVQREVGNALGEVSALLAAGPARIGLGALEAGMFDLKAALGIAERLQARRYVMQAHHALSKAYEASGDLAPALAHGRQASDAERTLLQEQMERSTAAVMAGFTVERAVRDSELERIRNDQLEEANAALRTAYAEKDRLLEQVLSQQGDLARSVRTDPLTGLVNRRALHGDLERRFREARRYGRELALALVDIDHFKAVNDTARSHEIGDEVLRTVATILCAESRNVDLVARWGGEEFAICFPSTTREAAAQACERVREVVELTDWSRIHPEIGVTVSIGLAGSGEADTPEELVFTAEERLEEAKEQGRNQLCW
jgi:diguanylate cyclase (GGDEF)-like protein